jgi:predicted enzyme related to lactoylglutathione lyase
MPYLDNDRVARFYERAFGWRMQQLGEDMGNYVLAVGRNRG